MNLTLNQTKRLCAAMSALCLILIVHANAATFSDTNWISMNPGINGTDCDVLAAVVDGSGNLYIGGCFTAAGDVVANGIAKWDGTNWTALGSGLGAPGFPVVYALAVSGNDVYAGGNFTTAGGIAATN